jgi:ABC-type dipeptide/oligopeptide/nickel transport system ATPase component
MCERVLVLRDGVVVEEGTVDESGSGNSTIAGLIAGSLSGGQQ